MRTTEIVVTRITATAEKWLTPVVVNEDEPVISKEIFLGANDSAENWREITEEEKKLLEHNAKIKQEKMMKDFQHK